MHLISSVKRQGNASCPEQFQGRLFLHLSEYELRRFLKYLLKRPQQGERQVVGDTRSSGGSFLDGGKKYSSSKITLNVIGVAKPIRMLQL